MWLYLLVTASQHGIHPEQVDTRGAAAEDELYVTYHGEALNPSMKLLVTNTLQYTLQLFEVEREESY
jgi:hypothetical protein